MATARTRFLAQSRSGPSIDRSGLERDPSARADLPARSTNKRFARCADYLKERIDWDTLAKTRGDCADRAAFPLVQLFRERDAHAPGLPATDRLPAAIAVPLVELAKRVGRPPILSYASYCLHNWRRLDPAGPIALDNIALLQNFSTPGDGKSDEDWFILVHVNIEAYAGPALRSVQLRGTPSA